MPKYETAWYLTEKLLWQEVSFRELLKEERRAELREQDLRDKRNGVIVLGIRNHPTTPHFFDKRRIRSDIEPGVNESVAHERAKRMLRSYLSKYAKHNFGFYERPWDAQNMGFDSLVKVADYQWGVEVSFGLMFGKFLRFDILGRSREEIEFTDKFPMLAVEVVDTHFHSQETFKVLLEVSKNIPLIIAYYFVSKAPIHNSVHKPERANSFSKVRLHCYISDGSFWFRNERVEELFKVNPMQPDIYYNLIYEKLYKEKYVRSV